MTSEAPTEPGDGPDGWSGDTAQSVPWRAVGVLGTGLFGLGLAVGSYGAVVTALIDRGIAPGTAGFGMTLFLLGQLVAALPADRLGRRWPVARVAGIGFAVGTLGCLLATRLTPLAAYASRLLLGIGMGTAFVAGMTHLGLRTTGPATATSQGYLGALFTLGLAGGVAGGPIGLDTIGPAAVTAAAPFVAAGAVATRSLADEPAREIVPILAYLRPFGTRDGLVLGLGNMASFGFLIVATTWYADVLSGVGGASVTVVLAGFALATVIGRGAGGRLAAAIGDRAAVAVSFVGLAAALGGVAAALGGERAALLAALAATGVGFGLPFGPLFALTFANLAEEAGVTLVAMTMIGNAGALVYPWLVGRLLATTSSFVPGFALMAASVALTLVLWLATVGTGVVRPETSGDVTE